MTSDNWVVDLENRNKFEKCVISWGTLIQTIGWDSLSDMYVRRVPPFQDVPELTGREKKKQARQILLNQIAFDMKEAGLRKEI